MKFESPILLLLAVPLAVLYARFLRPPGRRLQTILHATLLALTTLALAGPYIPASSRAIDLVIVADRSRSMPPEADARQRELIGMAERQREPGARLGIVAVGARARVEQLPTAEGSFAGFAKSVDPDASNLAEGIETAVQMVGPGRGGRILVLSDGLPTGQSPLTAASAAAARGIPVDYRLFERPRRNDVAVERVVIPAETDAGASFQGYAWIRSETPMAAKYRIFRDDTIISEGDLELSAGSRPLSFRDRLPSQGGICRYRVEILSDNDPVPKNNLARAVLRVLDTPRILVVTGRPAEDNLTRSLRAAGLNVDRATTARMPQDLADLDPYRAVVLEDVAAGAVGADAMRALRAFVEDGGGGLLVTGGRSSFGVGGYFKSDLDGVLPVSMELRQEHRKFRMAMAIALDRSGSMAVQVDGGLQKMDLANRGTVEAIRTLTSMDEVAVIAVDSSAHVVVPLTKLADREDVVKRVLRIQSEGGGIFVYTALLAAGKALEGSTAATRHIVLFADAADSEEPGAYRELLARYVAAGITVSVIGLGTEKDSDAEFIKDVARLGRGRIFFTNRPEDLPRLFAQETLSVTRSTFVEEPSLARWLPDARLLGEVARAKLPTIGGYNLTYLRPEAAAGAVTEDEFKAPILAFWHRGVGRAAAFTPEADGPTSTPLLVWKGYDALFAGLGRWLLGEAEPQGVSVTLKTEEPDVRVILEGDPQSEAGRELLRTPPLLNVLTTTEGGGSFQAPFQWTGARTLEARFTMEREGIYLPAVRLGGGNQVLRAPPVMLPYSPEFLPRRRDADTLEGAELLDEIAWRTGGKRRETLEGLFELERARSRERFSLRMPLAWAVLALLLFEVTARRLRLWETAVVARMESGLMSLGSGIVRRMHAHPSPAAPAETKPPVVEGEEPPPAPPAPPPPPPPAPITSALDLAKRRARQRFDQDKGN